MSGRTFILIALAALLAACSRSPSAGTPALREWLGAGYRPDYEDHAFAVWRRKD